MTDVKAIIDVHNQQQDTIESLRKQLAHSEMAANAEAKYADELRQQLAECQAREKVLLDLVDYASCELRQYTEGFDVFWDKVDKALAMPSDSIALDTLKLQWQREALLKAAEVCRLLGYVAGTHTGTCAYELIRIAEELK